MQFEAMSGNFFGAGYAGVASYLVTGAGDIMSNSNQVYVGVSSTATCRKDRSSIADSQSDSEIGAPLGPFRVCISEFNASASDKCGAVRTFKSGEYKFSIFGHIFDPVDFTEYDHLGFRMKVRFSSLFFYLLCFFPYLPTA